MVTTIISIIIAGLALVVSGTGLFMSSKKNNQQEASQLTTVIVKLENIGNDVKEIKTDLREVKADIKNHSERLAIVEQQVRALNHIVYGDKSE